MCINHTPDRGVGVVAVLVAVAVAVAVGFQKKIPKIKTATATKTATKTATLCRGFAVFVSRSRSGFDFSIYELALIACNRSSINS